MSKRQALLLEGNLASPPVVSDFLDAVKAWDEKRKGPKQDDPVHGAAFANVNVGRPAGSQQCQQASVKSALEFK